jgi:5-methylcytosine-specific restriction endonuclease McrA
MAKQAHRPYSHLKSQKNIKKEQENICSVCLNVSDSGAHGHHLIPFSEGGSENLSNFLTLCKSCHADWHSGRLKIDISRF